MTAAFNDFNEETLKETINKALEEGVDALAILNVLLDLLKNIGERFSQGEAFLPELVMSGDLMEKSVEILKPALVNKQDFVLTGEKIILGSVKGDVHTIGKDMVKMMWIASGYEVIDLGINVPAETFFTRAQEINPSIVALSSTMTTTIPSMKDTIDFFKSRGLDKKYKIIVGGGSVNTEIANNVGAYAYGGRDAYEAVKTVKAILAE
ncbi:hypothetical protein DCMF_08185 [Candidatus Formimonas warabiya]|uniref:Cobalamin-binding protein n=2 Tax=Formimonas warabiya TaxID=1761012 RepID=A0A3G1L1D6_FORW1|nr:hypothetical protein DCMF_08185 [Candidatus Formimonas warabiya]